MSAATVSLQASPSATTRQVALSFLFKSIEFLSEPEGRSYASESATECGYEIVFTFYGLGFPSPHLAMPGQGQNDIYADEDQYLNIIEIADKEGDKMAFT